MSRILAVRRLLAPCLVAAATMAPSCHDAHDCNTIDSNNWAYYGFDFDVTDPRRCPIPIDFKGQVKHFGATALNPYGNHGFSIRLDISNYEGESLSEGIFPWFTDGQGRGAASVSGSYAAGTGTGPDEALVVTGVINGDIAAAAAYLTWQLPPPLSVTLTGPTTIPVGGGGSWSANASGGVQPYTYQWFRNGIAITGATSQTYSYGSTVRESFNLSVRVRTNLGEVKTTPALGVISRFDVSIEGPTLVTGAVADWYAVTYGGGTPLQYQWYWDGTPAGMNDVQITDWGQMPDGTHELRADVTDSYSNEADVRIWVTFCRNSFC